MANSCLHPSNSRQIKTHVNLQHDRRSAVALTWVAACVLVLFYVIRLKRNRKRWRNRTLDLDEIVYQQRSFLARTSRPLRASYRRHCGLSKFFSNSFSTAVETPHTAGQKSETKLKVVSRSSWRSFINVEVSRKWSACFDWLTVTNTRFPIVASSIFRQQFASVFAGFTHTNLSFPSRVCSGPVSQSSKMSTCSVCLFVFNKYFLFVRHLPAPSFPELYSTRLVITIIYS